MVFNITVLDLSADVVTEGRFIKLFILILIEVVAVCANIFFLYITCYRNENRNKTRTFIYFAYVSVANLSLALFVIPFPIIALTNKRWILGSNMCLFNGLANSICLTSCIYSITILSIHKYLTIVSPIKRRSRGHREVFSRIALSLVLAIVVSIIPFMESNVYFNKYTAQCAIFINKRRIFYTLFIVCTVYFIPTVINVFIYYRIFKALGKHIRRVRRNSFSVASSVLYQKKTVKTLYMAFGSFIFSWTPFFVYAMIYLSPSNTASTTFLIVAYVFGYSNSVLNPIIFISQNVYFTQSWRSIFRKKKTSRIKLISAISLNYLHSQSDNEQPRAFETNYKTYDSDDIVIKNVKFSVDYEIATPTENMHTEETVL